MGEPVGRRVRCGVVERDRARVEPLDRLEQVGSEALVVGDDIAIGAEVADARRVEAADDGDPLAACRHDEGAVPRAVRAGDEVEAGVLRQQRLARERQPEIDVLLAKDPRGLVELLVDENVRRAGRQVSHADMMTSLPAGRLVVTELVFDARQARFDPFETEGEHVE